jgi:hypothetical protein
MAEINPTCKIRLEQPALSPLANMKRERRPQPVVRICKVEKGEGLKFTGPNSKKV